MKNLAQVPVLLVSEAQEQELLAVWLQSEGADFHACGWAEARAFIERDPHAVVVLDLRTGTDGATRLMDALRAELKEPLPKLIALLPGLQASEAALALRCNKYLTHPMHPADLVSAIAGFAPEERSPSAPDLRAHAHEAMFQNLLEARAAKQDLRGLLRVLNASGPFRYTAILRFEDDEQLTSVWTFDRDSPEADGFPTDATVSSSYCARVRDAGAPFVMPDAANDPSVQNHPARYTVLSYCGVPLVNEGGQFFGTLCQFDLVPRLVGGSVVPKLTQAADILRPHLAALSRSRAAAAG